MGFCRSPQERLFLQALGMATGVKSWADDFKEMQKEAQAMKTGTIPPSHPIPPHPAPPTPASNVSVYHPF